MENKKEMRNWLKDFKLNHPLVIAGPCSAETEDQVEKHLDSHLQRLPNQDQKSRAIIEKMKQDEHQHGQAARDLGGKQLPLPVQKTMQLMSKVMTTGAYWV